MKKNNIHLVLSLFFLLLSLALFFDRAKSNKDFLRTKLTESFIDLKVGCGSVISCKPYRSGNGFITLILTANHVLEDQTERIPLRIPTFSPTGEIIAYDYMFAKKIFSNKEDDFAILKISTKYYIPSVSISTEQLSLLDDIYQIGRPNKSKLWITRGEVAYLNFGYGSFGYNANTYYGNSGGPIFNLNGEQIGICISAAQGTDGYPVTHMARSMSILHIKKVLGDKQFRNYFNE